VLCNARKSGATGKYISDHKGDFPACIKGKSSFVKMREACEGELANVILAINSEAVKVQKNFDALEDVAKGFGHLFADISTIIKKDKDDLLNLAKTRIIEHKDSQRKAAEELAEKERDRIRAEEEAKAKAMVKAEAKAKVAAEAAIASFIAPAQVATEHARQQDAADVAAEEPQVLSKHDGIINAAAALTAWAEKHGITGEAKADLDAIISNLKHFNII